MQEHWEFVIDQVNLQSKRASSPLHVAIASKSLQAVFYLIDLPSISLLLQNQKLGVNINAQDEELNTPLHLATGLNLRAVVKVLLENQNCNPSIRNKFGQRPIDLADDAPMLNTFKSKSIDFDHSYSRTTLNNQVLKNSRFDHTLKILSQVSSLQKVKPKLVPSSFEFLLLRGKGSFGKVYKVRDPLTNKIYALKALNKSRYAGEQLSYAFQERDILTSLKTQQLRLIASFQTSDCLILLMDYIEGKDLREILEEKISFTEKETAMIIAQLAVRLKNLHSEGIIYRDLKPQNVILNKEKTYLVDFGLAKKLLGEPYAYSICGTWSYLAPEMICKRGHDESLDWYLLGVLTYELLHGITPFYDNNLKEFFKKVLEGNLELSKQISKEASQFIISLMKMNQMERAGFEEVKQSKFLKDIDFDKLENESLQSQAAIDSNTPAMKPPFSLNEQKVRNFVKEWNRNV